MVVVGVAGLIEITANSASQLELELELGKSNKIVGFHPARNAKKKIMQWSPLCIIFKRKI